MDVAKIESSPLTVLYVIHDGKASPLATESGQTWYLYSNHLSTRALTGLVKNSFFRVHADSLITSDNLALLPYNELRLVKNAASSFLS